MGGGPNSNSWQTIAKQSDSHTHTASDARIMILLFDSSHSTSRNYCTVQLFVCFRVYRTVAVNPPHSHVSDRHASERTNFILQRLIPVISFITGLATPKSRSKNCVYNTNSSPTSLKLASASNQTKYKQPEEVYKSLSLTKNIACFCTDMFCFLVVDSTTNPFDILHGFIARPLQTHTDGSHIFHVPTSIRNCGPMSRVVKTTRPTVPEGFP
jgi:hypothetical protein